MTVHTSNDNDNGRNDRPPLGGSPRRPKRQKREQNNVRVVARIRPLAEYETEKGCSKVVQRLPRSDSTEDGVPEQLSVDCCGSGGDRGNEEKRWFELDAVFDGDSTQEHVYEKSGAMKAVTQDLFRGFNCTILA